MDEQNKKIKIKLPCKCIKEVPINKLEKKIKKYFIRHIECKDHNVFGRDVFLKKINNDLYKAILDTKEERKIFREEDDFFVFTYNKTLFRCPECNTDICGRNMLNVNNYKRSYWEVDYKCPKCGFSDTERVDSRYI